ncbi:MAG: thioredoxin-dependent thiol peroxidase [Prevotellaceae bacterium]|nr:thioredoxin-dependent thiol peroxidase [Prevotellaceae bacterium]
MNIGDKAPELLGLDENGQEVRLSAFRGKRLALYFYPKDMTPGCTSQACNLRDNYQSLQARGYEVVGVSVNTAKQHQKFIEKNSLPFTLVADTEAELARRFGVWGEKRMCGRTYMGTLRTTFIIDADSGAIEHIITPKEIKVKDHASQILES